MTLGFIFSQKRKVIRYIICNVGTPQNQSENLYGVLSFLLHHYYLFIYDVTIDLLAARVELDVLPN